VPPPSFRSPLVPAEYAAAAEKAMASVIQQAEEGASAGWVVFKEQDNVRMSRREVPGLPVDFLKGEGVIAASIETILRAAGSVPDRAKWDDMFESGSVLHEFVPGFDVAHMRFKGMWPVAGRDLCVIRGAAPRGDGSWVAFSVSVDYAACPPPGKYVRAQLYPTGFLLRPRDGGRSTDVVYVAAMDLRGSIPGSLKKKVSLSIPLTVHKLRRYVTGSS
jgi:hypothetical protein